MPPQNRCRYLRARTERVDDSDLHPQLGAQELARQMSLLHSSLMITVKCPVCAGRMVRNGRTSAGAQGWLCPSCRSTKTHRCDTEAKKLEAFLDWLLGRARQADMAGGGRSFRRDAARFWRLWPVPEPAGELHRVVFADGIHLARDLVVLIATDGRHVLSWHAAPAIRSWTTPTSSAPRSTNG